MTDNQKNIIGTILLNMSASTIPVTEEMIATVYKGNIIPYGLLNFTSFKFFPK